MNSQTYLAPARWDDSHVKPIVDRKTKKQIETKDYTHVNKGKVYPTKKDEREFVYAT